MSCEDKTVSLRERVKAPPAQSLVDSYYVSAVEAGIKYQFEPEMLIHLAHALMLERQGIVQQGDIARIIKTLLELRESGPAALKIDYLQEDLYSYVESSIVKKLGREVGGRLHTARSRNDLHTTSWRLALRSRLLDLIENLILIRETTLRLADEHSKTVMPGYTHTQHAQPISFGYYLLTVADLLSRDYERVRHAFDHCNCSPLGAGALSTTGFPIDRDFVRDLLGFPKLVEVAYDAVSCRDDAHEAVAAVAVLMTGLSRLATDLQTWNTMEYGMIELADEYSSVSSIMPQKKNPHAMEHIKASAAHVIGALTAALACSKNTSLADVHDGVTALNLPVVDAVDRTNKVLHVMDGVLQTATVHPARMLHLAEIGFGTATELADVIVRETGLSFRMAHNIVGTVVRETIEAGRTALTITSADLDRASETLFGKRLGIDSEIIKKSLDPTENIRLRTVTGGPAPDAVHEMLNRRLRQLEDDRDGIAAVRKQIDDATNRLLGAAKHLAATAGETISDRPRNAAP
jgi:argininosuccinate lyase